MPTATTMATRRNSAVIAVAISILFGGAGSAEAKWPIGYVPRVRTWFSYGLRYSQPQEAALSLTVMRALESDAGIVTGWFVQAVPGLGGGKVSLGFGGLSPSDHIWLPPIFGAGLKASVMRTWGSPVEAPPNQTWVGPEIDFTLPYVKLSAGYLWRVSGSSGDARRLTWGVGVGF